MQEIGLAFVGIEQVKNALLDKLSEIEPEYEVFQDESGQNDPEEEKEGC